MECGTRLALPPPSGGIENPTATGASDAVAGGPLNAGAVEGAEQRTMESRVPTPPLAPPARPADPTELSPSHPEWRMSPAGPLPEQPRRRWVVWLGAALGACLFVCVAAWILGSTVFREPLESFTATQITLATQTAGEGTDAE